MSLIQRFFVAILPGSWAESMEAESRQWKMRCKCGHEKSYWEVGGIRWKAAGRPWKFGRCSQCGKWSWLKTYKDESVKS